MPAVASPAARSTDNAVIAGRPCALPTQPGCATASAPIQAERLTAMMASALENQAQRLDLQHLSSLHLLRRTNSMAARGTG